MLQSLAAFLVSMGLLPSGPKSTSSPLGLSTPDLPNVPAYRLKLGYPSPSAATLLHPRITPHRSMGILTHCPSITPFGLTLGAD